ncbi:MAG: acyl-CoA dehydrogenase [Streptosporangiales bacterium]|nr:acyl-CoA dehydrogenase [Streptosporangiales bacterium]
MTEVTETSLLTEVVDDVLAGTGPDPDGPLPPPLWRTVTEMGWPLVGIPEDLGGAGGGMRDLTVIVAGVGRHAALLPVIETALAAWVLAVAGRSDLLGDEDVAAVVLADQGTLGAPGEVRLHGDGRDGGISGRLDPVPWGRVARRLVVYPPDTHGPVLLEAQGPGRTVETGGNLADEPRDVVRLDAAPVSAYLDDAAPADEVRARMGLLRAAGLVGAARAALAFTRDHVSVRRQFDRPLTAFQAVAAGIATMACGLAEAESALERAAAVHDRPSTDTGGRLAATAAARVCAGRAATEIARLAHQLHGAIGTTREYPLHNATRRLWAWRDEDGAEHRWAGLLGGAAAEGGEAYLWDALTD